MRKLVVLFAALLFSSLVSSCQRTSVPNGPRVLLIAREKSDDMAFMLQKEVFPMIELLKRAGYELQRLASLEQKSWIRIHALLLT